MKKVAIGCAVVAGALALVLGIGIEEWLALSFFGL